MTQPLFTFAIVNWNTRELLDGLLQSIQEVKGDIPVEVLVADNASSDGSAEMVTSKYPEVKLVRNTANLGFARGHETLFPLSKGHYHVLVNSDVRIHQGCLETVAARMQNEPDIGVLGTRIIGPDNHIQPSCRQLPSLWHQFIDATGLNRLFPKSALNAYKMGDFDHQSSRNVGQVMGSFFVIRRELIEKIGILDSGFFMYYEEVDYCLRTQRAGYRVFYEADASVWHEGGGSSKKVKVLTIRRTIRSMRRYFKKNHGAWTWLPLIPIVSLDLVTHTIFAAITRNKPLQTFKAYGLGLWDLIIMKRANL